MKTDVGKKNMSFQGLNPDWCKKKTSCILLGQVSLLQQLLEKEVGLQPDELFFPVCWLVFRHFPNSSRFL